MVLTKPKFNIGDTVATKKIGPPVIGEIIAILPPNLVLALCPGAENTMEALSEIYSTIEEEYWYYIEIESRSKSESFEAYSKRLQGVLTEREIAETYRNLPTFKQLGYPESDLELL